MIGNKKRWNCWANNPDLVAALILIAAGLLFFSDAIFSSKNFYYRDILNFHYPLRKVLIDAFARWEFPLWNPFVYLGQPMLANPNYMTFYPTNLLHLFLSFNYAFKLHFIIHPIAGGLGFYFLVRRLGIRSMASLVGALSYQFSGVVLSFLNLYNIVPAVALMPWAGWAFYGALQKHTMRRAFVFGIFLAFQIIAFEPLIIQCTILMLSALATVRILEQQDRSRSIRQIAYIVAAGVLLAGGLTAVQTMPTLELLPLSARSSGLGIREASEWSVHPLDLLNTAVPNFFGYPFTIDVSNYWGESYHEATAGYMASFFVGSLTLLMFSLSFLSTRKKLRTAMLSFLGISVLLGLGKYTPVYPWMYEHVPFFNLGRYPSKYFLVSSLIISILAALGLEVILGRTEDEKIRIKSAGIAGAVLGICVIGLAFYWGRNPIQLESLIQARIVPSLVRTKDLPAIASSLIGSIKSTGIFLLLGGLLMVSGRLLKRPVILGALFAVSLSSELIPANLGLAPLISDADMDFVPEVDQYILNRKPPDLGRAVSPNIMTPEPRPFNLRAPNRSMAWMVLFYRRSGQNLDGIRNGIPYSINGSIDHLNTRETELLLKDCLVLNREKRLDLLANLNSPIIMSMGQLQDPRAEFLNRFDTHSDLEYSLYRLKGALSRAYFATNVIQAESKDDARTRLLDSGILRDTVILDSPSGPLRSFSSAGGGVNIERYENNRVLCRVKANSDGYLVLLDSYYPGWRAKVDGRETPILRANYAFRAVRLPVGDHLVEFVFSPRSFYIGLLVTLATSLIAAFLGVWMWIGKGKNHWSV